MKTEEILKAIYDEASIKIGPHKARQYLTAFFSNMIFDLEEEKQIFAKVIRKRLEEELAFIKKANDQNVA